VGALIHYGTYKANSDEPEKAIKYFKHTLEVEENNITAKFMLGKCLYKVGKSSEEPVCLFEEVIKQDPKHFKAYCQLGIIYLEKDHPKKAAEFLKECLSLNSKYIPGLIAMGNLLFENGHSEKAV
jgi:tetratricopeptide (TPR) repeat protein